MTCIEKLNNAIDSAISKRSAENNDITAMTLLGNSFALCECVESFREIKILENDILSFDEIKENKNDIKDLLSSRNIIIAESLLEMLNTPDSDNCKPKSNKYLIPVEWSVCSNIFVEADSLEEALKIAQEHLDDIPCTSDNEYIDGSYKIQSEDIEVLAEMQAYQPISDLTLDRNGKIK